MYNIIEEFNKVINKTKWIDAEDYYEIEPFLRQAEIEIERQTKNKIIGDLRKWAEENTHVAHIDSGSEVEIIEKEFLLQELQNNK